jgi:hypothetical protein
MLAGYIGGRRLSTFIIIRYACTNADFDCFPIVSIVGNWQPRSCGYPYAEVYLPQL